MNGARERFSVILTDEKGEIEEFERIIKEAGDLRENIRDVKSQLVLIENNLKSMDNKFKNKIKKIEEIDEEIKQLNFEVRSENIDIISQVIIDNLPDGFDGIENSEECAENILKNIKIRYKSSNGTNLRKDKDTYFEVGEINILVTEDKEFKVEVMLGNEGEPNFKETDFLISKLYRIYKIIVWINTNLHYHE